MGRVVGRFAYSIIKVNSKRTCQGRLGDRVMLQRYAMHVYAFIMYSTLYSMDGWMDICSVINVLLLLYATICLRVHQRVLKTAKQHLIRPGLLARLTKTSKTQLYEHLIIVIAQSSLGT